MKPGVVIPAYNEHESIAALIIEVHKLVPDALIVVVDDSPDEKTARALDAIKSDRIHLIRRVLKGGRGSAILDGIRLLLSMGADRIVEMDADFSHPPSQVPELIAKSVRDNLDLLIASRYTPQSQIKNWPLGRRVFSCAANKLARVMLGVPVRDYTNGFRCYSRRAAELISQTCGKLGTGFIGLSEILVNLYWRGYTVSEVPTVFVNRVRGESSLSFKEISNAARGLVLIFGLKRKLKRGNE